MLDSILTPIATEDFFRRWWTREFLHIPGHSGKFSHLFPWEVLNRALEEHRFDAKRLVLYKSGKKIESGRYLNGQWVDTGRLVNELSNGCTLIFNACEEVYPPLRDLCVHLEGLVHHRVTANLYAGWRRDNGFNVHWDTQDTIILQVAGRKQWKVWKPAHPRPFHDDLADTSTPPTEAPVWDGTLEPGCLLSIPRGWWHVAYPMDEPCLHLTVTVQNLNGIDFLHWLAEQMKSSEAARMEMPIAATGSEQAAWLERVRADLLAVWDENLFARCLAEVDSKAVPRPHISLPADPDPHQNGLRNTTLLELAAPRPLQFSNRDGRVVCQAAGMGWQMDSDVAERLRAFNDRQPHAIGELAPEPDLRMAGQIGVMVMTGVLRRVR